MTVNRRHKRNEEQKIVEYVQRFIIIWISRVIRFYIFFQNVVWYCFSVENITRCRQADMFVFCIWQTRWRKSFSASLSSYGLFLVNMLLMLALENVFWNGLMVFYSAQCHTWTISLWIHGHILAWDIHGACVVLLFVEISDITFRLHHV